MVFYICKPDFIFAKHIHYLHEFHNFAFVIKSAVFF